MDKRDEQRNRKWVSRENAIARAERRRSDTLGDSETEDDGSDAVVIPNRGRRRRQSSVTPSFSGNQANGGVARDNDAAASGGATNAIPTPHGGGKYKYKKNLVYEATPQPEVCGDMSPLNSGPYENELPVPVKEPPRNTASSPQDESGQTSDEALEKRRKLEEQIARNNAEREAENATTAKPEGAATKPEGAATAKPGGATAAKPEGATAAKPERATAAKPEGAAAAKPKEATAAKPEVTENGFVVVEVKVPEAKAKPDAAKPEVTQNGRGPGQKSPHDAERALSDFFRLEDAMKEQQREVAEAWQKWMGAAPQQEVRPEVDPEVGVIDPPASESSDDGLWMGEMEGTFKKPRRKRRHRKDPDPTV